MLTHGNEVLRCPYGADINFSSVFDSAASHTLYV